MTSCTHHHFLVFAAVALVAWAAGTFAFVYFQPQLFYNGVKRAVVRGLGFKKGGIPVNTLYALSTLASPSLSKSNLILTGNRDTLYVGGALDLGEGPQILHVPDMAGRYYSVEVFGRCLDVVAIVGRRTTGTCAADYLISGPDWIGTVPDGVTRIVSPGNSVLVIGRVLVEGEADIATAYDLAKQIQVTPLAPRHSGQ